MPARACSRRTRCFPARPYSGVVGGGGASVNTAGTNGGGAGGTSQSNTHPGAGGGGWTNLVVSGSELIVAGGGGGSGAGHTTDRGFGGNAGLPTGTGVTVGSDGQNGYDNPATITVGGGQGGEATTAGAGGVSSNSATLNGFAGSARTGGKGGNDTNADTGGGGGGGYYGAGGGASTVNQGSGASGPAAVPNRLSGAGGGGGASYVNPASTDGAGTAPTAISSSAGAKQTAAGAGASGAVTLTWVMCDYDLKVTKSVATTNPVNGGSVTWTVSVQNLGPDAMTQGDTLTLADALPAGATSITSVNVSGGTAPSGLGQRNPHLHRRDRGRSHAREHDLHAPVRDDRRARRVERDPRAQLRRDADDHVHPGRHRLVGHHHDQHGDRRRPQDR